MLKALSIKNVAVIERADIEFSDGLNLLTGETGAGKSIIIDSLNMLKGERTPKSIIRAGESKARVDGVLEVGADISESLSDEYGIECDGEILISREISADGKGSVRVNGMPMPLAMLRSMCENLINIHGQHDNTSLLSPKNHIGFLDSFSAEKISPLLADYKKIHSVCTELEGELSKTDIDEREAARRADLLKYQLDEIDAASLAVGEDSELAGRREVLENSFKISEAANKAYCALYEGSDFGGGSAYDSICTAIRAIEPIARFNPELETLLSSLNDACESVSDGAHFLKDFSGDVSSSGAELDEVLTRLEVIGNLKAKYGATIEDILKKRELFAAELDGITGNEQRKCELEQRLNKAYSERKTAADKLTAERTKCARILDGEIMRSLTELNMKNTVFETRITPTPCKADGADNVEFMICTNKGEELKPLASIASGGELSRIMLAIKSILSEGSQSGVTVFDEIDTGVSGAAAQRIGEKLWKMGTKAQVICITHLPQIAAMADSHYLILKQTDGARTKTSVRLLCGEERTAEIARTLGGAQITQAATDNAAELIRLADAFKKNGGKI